MNFLNHTRPFCMLLVVFSLVLIPNQVSGQSWEQEIIQKSQTYQATFHQRKVFVQTDRPVYSAGDTIWLSGFVLNAYNNQLNTSEKVLYIELLDPDGEISQKELFKIDAGRSRGDLPLSADLKSGKYRIVAYTNWMRNMGSAYYFSMPIWVSNSDTQSELQTADAEKELQEDVVPDTEEKISYSNHFKVGFYPESGNLLTGVPGKIAFEVKDSSGHPVLVNTLIKDDQNQIITPANTLWKGKGVFNLTPLPNHKYYMQVLGSDSLYALPTPEAEGVSMAFIGETPENKVQITIRHNMDTLVNPNYFLLAMQNGKPISGIQLNLSDRKEGSVYLDVDKYKTGIAQFTLFDAQKQPLCERITFIKNDQQIDLIVREKQLANAPRGKVNLEITSKDPSGFPVSTDLAIAITDANRVPDELYLHPNIFEYVALPADLPLSANEYASVFEQGREAQFKTELLMLTNGWRRYTWKEVLADTIGQPQFLEEPGIYVQGVVRTRLRKDKVPKDVDVSMISQGSQMELFTEKADKNGNFTFLLKDFQDTLRAVVQTKNQMQIKRDYKLNLFTNYYSRPTDHYEHWFEDSSDSVLQVSYLNDLLQPGILARELKRSLTEDTFMLSADVVIDEVTVNAEKPRTDKEKITRKYGAPDQTLGEKRLKDLVEEKPWNTGLMSMLGDAFPSLDISGTIYKFTIRMKDRRRHRFYIFVDGELIAATDARGKASAAVGIYEIEDITTMDAEVVKNIDLIFPYDKPAGSTLFADAEFYEYELKAFSTSTSAVGNDLSARLNSGTKQSDIDLKDLIEQSENMNAPPAILAIYTKDGGGVYSKTHYKGLAFLTVHGFSRVKEFYEPDYSDASQDSFLYDYRNTLAWFPQLKTDENGKAEISFYTSDISNRFRLEANGLDASGNFGALLYTQTNSMFTIEEQGKDAQLNRKYGKVDLSAFQYVQLQNGAPAAYALVKDVKNQRYTYASSDGSIDLSAFDLNAGDTVEINKPGYQTLRYTYGDGLNEPLTLKKAELRPVGEVSIKEIMRGFFKNKGFNSNRGYADYYGAYRELLFSNKELHRITDFKFLHEIPSLRRSSERPKSELVEGRDFHSFQADTIIMFTPKPGKTHALPDMNPLYADKSFLNRDLSKNYDYTLDGKMTFNGREVYIIQFNQKADAPYAMYTGKLYIDVETYGLVKAIWKISERGKQYLTADEFILAVSNENLQLMYEYNEASFDFNGEYWYPVYAISEVEFNLDKTEYGYTREMAWEASEEKLRVKPNSLAEMKKILRLSKEMSYVPSSWRNAWMLAPNTQIVSQFKYLNELYVYQKKK